MLHFDILISHSFAHDDLLVTYVGGPGERRPREATERIDRAWDLHLRNCVRNGLTVFDGRLFRLNGYGVKEGKISLDLGDTTFREYIGTSISDFHEVHPDAWVANPLAVCIALVTDDRKILVEKRTTLTRYRAPFHVIGGFMERKKDVFKGQPDPFVAITREVKEELGLAISPEEPVGLGLVRNLWVRHPEIVFFCKLRESFEDVKEIFRVTTTDNEIDQLEAADDKMDDLASFLRTHHGFFTPSGEACLLLYGRQTYGEDWYNRVLQELRNR